MCTVLRTVFKNRFVTHPREVGFSGAFSLAVLIASKQENGDQRTENQTEKKKKQERRKTKETILVNHESIISTNCTTVTTIWKMRGQGYICCPETIVDSTHRGQPGLQETVPASSQRQNQSIDTSKLRAGRELHTELKRHKWTGHWLQPGAVALVHRCNQRFEGPPSGISQRLANEQRRTIF